MTSTSSVARTGGGASSVKLLLRMWIGQRTVGRSSDGAAITVRAHRSVPGLTPATCLSSAIRRGDVCRVPTHPGHEGRTSARFRGLQVTRSGPLTVARLGSVSAAMIHGVAQRRAVNSSTERPAWRRIERRVPGASSRCIGTITVRPPVFRSFTWLPRWLISSKPTARSARTVSCPEMTGRRGVTQRCRPTR